jgi:hypothetical protein
MDFLTVLVVMLAAVAMVSLVVSPGTPRVLDVFAAGFLPYRDRSAGWPRGVQEEEPVPWSWTQGERLDPPPDNGSNDGLAAAEVFDISGESVTATRVGRSSTIRGLARRRR